MSQRIRWALAAAVVVLSSHLILGADEPAAKKPPAAATEDAKKKGAEDEEYYELYRVFAETMSQVEQNYVKTVDRRHLMEAAIRGLLDELDPYSNYISPDEIDRFKTSVESQFGGIGIQITQDKGMLKVLSPLVGSPAYLAGIEAGDLIIEIDGKPTENVSLDESVKRMKGEPGTSVKLTVLHAHDKRREVLTIEREVIDVETISGDSRDDHDHWNFMLDPEKKIAYIRLTAFSRNTAEDLENALKLLKKQGMESLILDLRFNPGGLLKSAIDVADLFIADGRIVSTKGRNTEERPVNARKSGTYEGFPMAVLVNRYSASASEIVSACLQDHKRAVVIGERTWGKGSVQNVIELEDGHSALKLTTAAYIRPSGRNIHRFPDAKETDEWGVMPDKGFDLKLSDAEMAELVRVRRDRDYLLVSHSPGLKRPTKAPVEPDEAAATDGKKPAGATAKRPASPPVEKKPNGAAPKGAKPAADPPAADAHSSQAADEFIDRQLQRAIAYVTEPKTEQAKNE